jgi:transaldolase
MNPMYELMLDTADLSELKEGFAQWPVSGVTTNPTILRREGKIDVYRRLEELRSLCGRERSLHVQVVSSSTQEIIEEAHAIEDRLGSGIFIKIPADAQGLSAIGTLSAEKIPVTATAVYTTMQGILAALAGAKYIAVYVNRMQNTCIDPWRVIRELRFFLDGGSSAKILAASFHNVEQVTEAFTNGAHSVTVGPDVLKTALSAAPIAAAVAGFRADFEALHGSGSTMKTLP